MKIQELLEDRRDFLKTRYMPLIATKLASFLIPANIQREIQHSQGNNLPEQIFSWLESRDPTKKKIYLQWILTCAVDRGVPFEDFEYLPTTLAEYDNRKRKNQLPPEAKDINQIKTPSALDVLLRDEANKQATASDRETQAAMRESKLIYQDEDWLIVTPTTEKAAQFWGRPTEWCTAYGDSQGRWPDRTCKFRDYNNFGPLVIIINQRDPQERYQWQARTEQYMDRDDKQIKPGKILRVLPVRAVASLVLYFPELALPYLSDPSIDIQMSLIKDDPTMIRYLNNPASEVQMAAVEQDPLSITRIRRPKNAVQLYAISKYPWLISRIKNPSQQARDLAIRLGHKT